MFHRCRFLAAFALAVIVIVAVSPGLRAADRFITLASTTSTANSGLFAHILPLFESDTGVQVRVIAVGTGQALRLARAGDADVLLVHHRPSEEKFVQDGYGLKRHDVMYNDFVIVGPAEDPAGVSGMRDARKALKKIAGASALFLSRGDDSGTHRKERSLWKGVGVDVDRASGTWYRETGSGMGATLNRASALDAYALTDRATWISFRNKGRLTLQVQGDPSLFNQYGVMLVNPARHSHVKAGDGQAFVDWLLSRRGQRAIKDFRVGGKRLFFVTGRVSG